MKTKYNVLLKEDLDVKTKSHWSKAGQYSKIKKILTEYPTAKQFKAAVMKTGDEKAISLVKNLDDDASRTDYVDFLQYTFNKYSKVGKYLLSGLVGLGTGAALSYLTGKAKEKEIPEAPNKTLSAIKGAVGGGVAAREIGKGGLNLYKTLAEPDVNSADWAHKERMINRGIDAATLLGSLGGGIGGWYSAKKAAEDRANEILKAKLIAGGIGAGVGGIGAHRVQSWREKHLQDKIDALKGYK